MILDRRLPDGTADLFLPVLRKRAPNASIVVVTGYGDQAGAVAALRSGAADYTLKPVNADALRARLASLAETRRLGIEKQRADSAFSALVEAAPCLIAIVGNDREILYVNSCAQNTSGFDAAEISPHLPIERLVGRQREANPVAATQTSFECPLACKSGLTRWIVWQTQQLDNYRGKPAVMAVGQDITELQAAQQKALQAERLAAIGEMMAGLSHESRNALQRSKACIEMLELEVSDRPDAIALVHRLTKAQEHLQRLYEEVRSYAAPVTLNRESCDIRLLWREVWSHVLPLHPDRVFDFQEEVSAADCRCLVDRFALGQVFRNILENAATASPSPGRIVVGCREAEIGDRPALEISFLDNGPGLNAEQAERIFEPFFTTKTKGTGLGMAIAKRIVDTHGGELFVRKRTPPGAEIVIVVPRGMHE
jgi:PAS domain S-box-containing protein